MTGIETLKQINGSFIRLTSVSLRAVQIGWRIFGIKVGALKSRGQESTSKIVLAASRESSRIVDRHERGQLLIFRTKCIRHPSSKRWKAFHREPGVHKVLTLRVGTGFRVQRMKEAKIVDLFSQVWEQVRNHFSCLTSRFEIPERFRNIA